MTRDGIDPAGGEEKVEQVMGLLERGEVEIWFDDGSWTCGLVVTPLP